MHPNAILDAAVLSGLALISVSLWTARVAFTARRRRAAAATIAAVEATVFVAAFSQLLSELDSLLSIVAYAVGVAGGTALAMIVDDALHPADNGARPPDQPGFGGPGRLDPDPRASAHRALCSVTVGRHREQPAGAPAPAERPAALQR